jgi:hypothetical protein
VAVAYDAGSQAEATSVNHVATGSNRLALAAIAWFGNSASVTGMTSNSVAMTQIGSTLVHPDSDNLRLAVFGIVAPSTSSVSYAATFSGSPLLNYIQVMTFTGVDQTTPVGTHAANTSAGDQTAVSSTVSSATNDLVADFMYAVGTAATVGAGQTERLTASDWGGNGLENRTSTEAGAASVDMTWTLGSANKWLQFAIPILQVAAAAANVGQPWQQKGAMGAMVSM